MPTKILILIDRLGRGGVAQVALTAALALDRQKFEPVICTTRDKPTHGHDEILRQAGVRLIQLDRRSRFDWRAWQPLWRELPSVTILHTHLSGSNFWGRLWGRLFRVPIIITQEHTSADQKLWYEHLADRLLSPLSDRIVAVSEYDRALYIELEHIAPTKIETLYVGIDVARFTCRLTPQEARQQAGLPADKQLLVMVARLFSQKNHQGLLEALSLLPDETRAGLHCLLVGSGELEDQLRQQVAQMGLQEMVSFLGERSDIPTILCGSDLLVLPSHYECLPSVISEAMAAGCPVVATAVGGIPEMLAGVGWPMVEPGDTTGLAEAITAVLHLPPTQRQHNIACGQQIVRERFGKEQSIARLEALYVTLLEEKRLKKIEDSERVNLPNL
jgi:glycosyltransferase involved in cell wall biosynthesis